MIVNERERADGAVRTSPCLVLAGTRMSLKMSPDRRRTGGSSGGVRDISSSTTNLRARSSSLERPFDACSDSGCHKNIPDVTDGGFDR